MGATSDVAAAMHRRGVSPLALWIGILAGPIAFAGVLTIKYAAAQWACVEHHRLTLGMVDGAGLLITLVAGWVAWRELGRTPADSPTDSGQPLAIARFLALLGLAMSALFVVVMIANDVPPWVLDACR